MGIYIIILVISLFAYITNFCKNKKNKNLFIIIVFALLVIIAALRSFSVGVDSLQYYNNYKLIGMKSTLTQVLRYEKGFYYLCTILNKISENPQILFIISSVFIISTVGRFIYKFSDNVALSTCLYITLNIYFFHLTGMRQSLAMAIMIIAIEQLFKDKKLNFILLILLASSFHSSALFLLSFLLFDRIKYTKKTYYIFSAITILSFIFYSPLMKLIFLIFPKYGGYIGSTFGEANYFGALFQTIMIFFIYTICNILYFKSTRDDNKKNAFYLKCLGFALIFQCLSMRMIILSRMVPYFNFFAIIAIPNCLKNATDARAKLKYIFLILTVTISYWLIICIYRPEWNGAVPYSFFWNN